MKEQLEAMKRVLEAIEVHGVANLRCLLSCIGTVETLLKQIGEKERVAE